MSREPAQKIEPYQAALIGLAADLPGASRAVSRVHAALGVRSLYPSGGTFLVNEPAREENRSRLREHFASLAASTKSAPINTLLVFFAGHARRVSKGAGEFLQLMLPERATSKEMGESHKRLEDDWVDWSEFIAWVSVVYAKNVVLFFDCCYSGMLLQDKATKSWLACVEQQSRNVLLVAGSAKDERAWEQDGYCFFTEALSEGLEELSLLDSDDSVTTASLYTFLREEVPRRARDAGMKQTPGYNSSANKLLSIPLVPPTPAPVEQLERDYPKLVKSIRRGRCLVWVGEALPRRIRSASFYSRNEWPSLNLSGWLASKDKECQPGIGSQRVARLRLSLLDTGFDTCVARCMRQEHGRHLLELNPLRLATSPPIQSGEFALIRPYGDPGKPMFCYTGHDRQQRFEEALGWLQRSKHKWDTILALGVPEKDDLHEALFGKLIHTLKLPVWTTFSENPEGDVADNYRKFGLKLICDIDEVSVLQSVHVLRSDGASSTSFTRTSDSSVHQLGGIAVKGCQVTITMATAVLVLVGAVYWLLDKKQPERPLRASCYTMQKSRSCHLLGREALKARQPEKAFRHFRKARELYQRGCDGGKPGDCYQFGYLNEHGWGTNASRKDRLASAKRSYRSGCKQNFALACVRLGLFDEWYGASRLAETYYHKGCRLGAGEGCYMWGRFYQREATKSTSSVSRKLLFQKALEPLEQSCIKEITLGCLQAAHVLRALGQNKKAFTRYQQTCDVHKLSDGCVGLAQLYRTGKGVPRDQGKARDLLRDACFKKDNGWACLHLGRLYKKVFEHCPQAKAAFQRAKALHETLLKTDVCP